MENANIASLIDNLVVHHFVQIKAPITPEDITFVKQRGIIAKIFTIILRDFPGMLAEHMN